jgi:hypothetical protein
VEWHRKTSRVAQTSSMGRMAKANTRGATGWCLETNDLVLSKYVAGREKGDRFVRAALAAGLTRAETLLERLASMPVDAEVRERLRRRILADASRPPAAPRPKLR